MREVVRLRKLKIVDRFGVNNVATDLAGVAEHEAQARHAGAAGGLDAAAGAVVAAPAGHVYVHRYVLHNYQPIAVPC